MLGVGVEETNSIGNLHKCALEPLMHHGESGLRSVALTDEIVKLVDAGCLGGEPVAAAA